MLKYCLNINYQNQIWHSCYLTSILYRHSGNVKRGENNEIDWSEFKFQTNLWWKSRTEKKKQNLPNRYNLINFLYSVVYHIASFKQNDYLKNKSKKRMKM